MGYIYTTFYDNREVGGFMLLRICLLLTTLLISSLPGQAGGTLEVTSDPPGTTVMLEGDFDLIGVTPTVFTQPLTGTYELKASREGYESYSTRLTLTGSSPLAVNIKLAPKTRFKAFIRSAVIPGWGQFYAGDNTRGVLFGLSSLASGVAVLLAEDDFQSKQDTYEDALAEFNEARSIERKKELEEQVDNARQEAYDAETVRNVTLGVLGAVWVYNMLDAIIFFPDRRYEAYSPRVSLDTGHDFSRIGLALNFSF